MKDTVLWMHCTSPELADLAKQNAVVVLPVGAVEQHGPHMAVGCDAFLAEWIAGRVALGLREKGVPAVVAPTLTVTNSLQHMNFPGTVSLRPSTYMLVLQEWCRSIAAQGFRRIVIANSHGGNLDPTNSALVEINLELGFPVYLAELPFCLTPVMGLESESRIRHAGEGETSLLMAYDESLVDPVFRETPSGLVPPPEPEAAGLTTTFHLMETRTTNGITGNCRLASREKGEVLAAAAVEKLVNALSNEKLWAMPV